MVDQPYEVSFDDYFNGDILNSAALNYKEQLLDPPNSKLFDL